MKLYTRTGDDGSTGLFGGERVDKDAIRVEAYGTVDELNAALGLTLTACEDATLRQALTTIQSRLFDVGADLCSPGEAKKPLSVTQAHVEELEKLVDQVNDPLPELHNFILPGGSELAARLHLARTVARRAERRVVSLSRSEPVTETILPYLNRLNDLLFAMARRANQLAGVEDVPWTPARGGES